jgi:hypothetical protein
MDPKDQPVKRAERVTLDTNVVREHLQHRAKAAVVGRLLKLTAVGKIDLAITARIRADIPKPPLSDRLNKLPMLGIGEIPAPARLNSWTLGVDILGDDRLAERSPKPDDRLPTRRTPDWRDWDHLHAHHLSGRDVFLTWDRGILALRQNLRQDHGIIAMTPEEYVARCESAGT